VSVELVNAHTQTHTQRLVLLEVRVKVLWFQHLNNAVDRDVLL